MGGSVILAGPAYQILNWPEQHFNNTSCSASLGGQYPVTGLRFVPPHATVSTFSPLLTGSNPQALPFQRYSDPVALP